MVFKGSYIIDEEKNIVKQVAIKTTRNGMYSTVKFCHCKNQCRFI